jgi:tetratricopeptide (TPR) repeat protein
VEKHRINILINNPAEATEQDLVLLEDYIKKYPYAQILHILLAKILFLRNSADRNIKLTGAAIYSVDRAVLKKIILEKDYRVNNEKITPFQGLPNFKAEIIPDLPTKTEGIDQPEPDSSSIFAEVLKNLEQLKSLRKQFQFLELNETEDSDHENKDTSSESDETVTEIREEIKAEKKKPKKSKTLKKEAQNTDKKNSETKKKKQAEILEKDEELDSRVNVFFLKEIERNKKSIDLPATDKHVVQNQIIERFIEEQPTIGTIKKEVDHSREEANKDLAEKSTKFTDDLISENLAIIMLKQGKKDRAVDIYKKLIWKLPQKKAYFAARIEEINK